MRDYVGEADALRHTLEQKLRLLAGHYRIKSDLSDATRLVDRLVGLVAAAAPRSSRESALVNMARDRPDGTWVAVVSPAGARLAAVPAAQLVREWDDATGVSGRQD